MAQESSFFTNQVFKEARRQVMLDYTMAREVFVDMGEQMLRHNHQINYSWAQMLDYYTDLNNARRENDIKYVEKQGIAEDVHEPEDFVKFKSAFHEDAIDRQWEESSEQDTSDILKDLKAEINDEKKDPAPASLLNDQQ